MIKATILLLASAVNAVELRAKLDFNWVEETNPAYVSNMTTAKWSIYSKSETLDLFQKEEYLKNKYQAEKKNYTLALKKAQDDYDDSLKKLK